jgi:hypothetical protein
MNHRLTCYTLFDITNTGVPNRARPTDSENYNEWVYKRNTQCNFDTILQAVSLRAQPEVIKKPKKIDIKFSDVNYFGQNYKQYKKVVPCWTFEFTIHHSSVFEDGIEELGYLYKDCHNIPMIKCGTEIENLSNCLDTTFELRNVFFIKYNDE